MSGEGEVVVVTGSSGCLGHATVRMLLERDSQVHEIRCLDLVEPGELMLKEIEAALEASAANDPNVMNEATSMRKRKCVRQIRGDIRDINTVERTLAGADCVIHCAARVDIWTDSSDQNAAELESVNVQGTENLLAACVRLDVPKFVHVSSFEVFASYHTIYYATESTIPEPKHLLFGASGASKRDAEAKVRQYANVKLKAQASKRLDGVDDEATRKLSQQRLDSLNAVIIRFTPIYGEHDRFYVSKILNLTRRFNGKLQRFTNVWIRQQPIYVGNAAWALVKAKQRMSADESISGEEFHITDDTPIGDPFDFLEPFVQSCSMEVTKSTFPAWPVWLLIVLFTFMRNSLAYLDIFGLFTKRKSRLDEAIELDARKGKLVTASEHDGRSSGEDSTSLGDRKKKTKGETRWYHMINAQIFYFMCNSLFLNRTKASLRLDYEPIFNFEESLQRSLSWYKTQRCGA